jgi:single stranded DNA-binding protein
MSLNLDIKEGNLTRDPELFAPVNSEWTCLKFGVCWNKQKKKKEGEGWDEEPHFFDCEYWTKNPKQWAEKLRKGTHVIVKGKTEQQRWEKDGQQRSKTILVLDEWPVIIPRQPQAGAATTTDAPTSPPPAVQDDCPF